jgi:hypothetical protein
MKRQHITELKLNRIKNPCLACTYLHNKRDGEKCINCNKNMGEVDNYKERV